MKRPIRTTLAGFALAGLTALIVSCALFPVVTPEDAGDEAFVRQAVPVLHGRKIRGHAEVKFLSDLIDESSRETVLRVLMEQPDFTSHWSEVLVDDLRIDREGPVAMTTCYGNPLRATVDASLAQAVVTTAPATPAGGGAFNMSDLTRSALAADNLYPLFRAHLYPHVTRTPFNLDEQGRRDFLGAKFGETYLNRQMGCLGCHNSEFSASGASSGWTRTYAIWGLFEKSLFGASTGEPTRNAYAMFRTDADSGGTLAPWGVQGCGTSYNTALPVDPIDANAHFISWRGKNFGVHGLQSVLQTGYQDLKTDGLRRFRPPALQAQCDFCTANCSGNTVDVAAAANNAPNAAAVKTLLNNRCSSCHGGAAGLDITNGADWANDLIGQPSSQAAGETRVIPGSANSSYLIKKVTNAPGIIGSRMPPSGAALTNAEVDLIRGWINGLPALNQCATCSTLDCRSIPQEVAGEEAFAFLVAANLVDNTWQEVFGAPVTIDNYFPRTFAQRQVLWNLTEYNLVPNDWSIRDLLVQIMTSNFFARTAPSSTTEPTAYDLPLVFDPWVEADPRIPPVSDPGYDPNAHRKDHKNSMTDAVYRYSARSLTNSVHKSLDWPQPRRFPAAAYPNADLMRAIGFYFSQEQPGFQVSDFQGLLTWEATHGVCQKPAGVAVDWIDRLSTAIGAFTPPSGEGPLSVGDVATVVRDWLLGHGELKTTSPVGLAGSEAEVVRTLFGVASLSDPVSGVADLTAKLRTLCGVQLQAPQFQLAGLVDSGLGPKPRLRVCNTTGDCTYREMCNTYAAAIRKVVGGRRTGVICGDDSVRIVQFPDLSKWAIFEEFCPPGLCGKLIRWLPEIYINPAKLRGEVVEPLTARVQMPSCDVRATQGDLQACGIPAVGRELEQGDVLAAWAEGATVRSAKNVRLLSRGADRYTTLERGYEMQRGDLLVVQGGGSLELRTTDGEVIRASSRNMPRASSAQVVPMLITGPTQDPAENFMLATQNSKLPLDRIHRILNSERARNGEAGPPLSEQAFREYRYSDAELDQASLRERGLLPEQLKAKPQRRARPRR